MTRPAGLRRTERGVATVLALTWMLLLAVVAGVGMIIAVATARQHKVDGAADLVSVSAASLLQRGEDACQGAAEIARRNDVELRSCRVDGDDVIVEVHDEVSLGFGLRRDLLGEARAGPTDP